MVEANAKKNRKLVLIWFEINWLKKPMKIVGLKIIKNYLIKKIKLNKKLKNEKEKFSNEIIKLLEKTKLIMKIKKEWKMISD